MNKTNNLKILNNINNELEIFTNEFKQKINAIDDLFSEYSNSNREKSWNERLFESQFNSLFLNSKALMDSIDENRTSINQVIKEFETV